MRSLVPALLTLPFLLGSACDQGGGHLHGDWLEVIDCKALGETRRYEPFEMGLEFISVTEEHGRALIRMAPSAVGVEKDDQLVITLEQAPEGGNAPAGYPLTGAERGANDLTLALLGRCRYATQPLTAVGSITFDRYGWREGDRVRGEMAFDLVDRRSGEIVGEGFVGDFDFEVKTGTPYTAFAPKDY